MMKYVTGDYKKKGKDVEHWEIKKFGGENVSEYGFEEDPRYKIGAKQALIAGMIYIIYCVGAVAIAFPLTFWRPADMPMKLVYGFPDWVFYSIILWPAIIVIATVLVVVFYFKEVPLGKLEEEG